jgi:indole-3-acetate monooxygenase
MAADADGEAYLERVRDVLPIIDAASAEIDASRDLPEPLFEALVARGLFRLLLPRGYGGAELSPLAFTRLLEEVGKHDASTGWCLGQNNVSATVAAYLEPRIVAEIFDSPRAIIAWGPGPAAAKVERGGFRLTGRFHFASGSRHATWMGANVPAVEADGSPRLAPSGQRQAYTLLFPRSSAVIEDTWHVIGLKGTGSDSYSVNDLFVPDAYIVPRGGGVKPRVPGPLYAFTPSTLYASSFSSVALGIGRATLEAFVRDVRDHVPRGASQRRGDNNVHQAEVGRSEARLRSARMFLRGSLEEIWQAMQASPAMTLEQRMTIRLATTWAIQQARETITNLYLGAGAQAIFQSGPFEKRFRDIHTLCQQIQGHAAHFETVGQLILGVEPTRPLFTF